MTNGLKKEDSAALKGLAVLLLIFHHCYRLADRIERYQVDLCGLTTEQLVAIAECCKICVAIFAFVSGYGLMYGYSAKMKNKEKYAVSEWISGHLLSTMSGFWFTAAVSYLIYFGLGLKDPSKWGETFYERGFAVFADILGISRLLETESLNGAWWYMSAAFVFIILLPLLDGTIEKFGGIFCIAVIFLLPRILGIGFQGGSKPYSFLLIFVAGMLCCKYNFFQKLHEYRRKKLKFICLSALLCAGFFLYHKIDLKIFWEFRYALVPFLLILFCVEYLFRITPVSLFLQYLGKHSMNIWLVHTFVRDSLGKYVFALKKFWLIPVAVLVHMDIQFDFVCMYDKIAYEEEIRKLGGRIYYIPNVKKNYQGYIKELKKILKETKYDAVHVNMLSAANIVPLRVAHTMKVPKIIAHSHSSSCPGLIRKIMDNWNRPKIAKYATDRVACGEMAGRWLFGDKAFQSGQVTLINNAIQAEKFSFSEKDRDSLRKELGWENKTVIGHVGRFDIPKNHDRMLDIFQQIVSEKKDVMLCLVGPKEGLYKEIKEKTVQKGLEDKVYFAGKQENIRRYLSAMDVFLFPSVFEGVPFALIEAQANGLACVMSEAVSEEAVVFPERVRRLSLDRDNIQWAAAVMAMSSMNREAADLIKMRLSDAHFNIETEAKRLKDLYYHTR